MYSKHRRIRQLRRRLAVICFLSVGCITMGSIGIKYDRKGKTCSSKEDEELDMKREVISVRPLFQNPELPTGCEATATAMLLCAYGYRVDKTVVANYMEKEAMQDVNERRYAPHPDEKFIGDPYTEFGYGAFPNVMEQTAQKIIDEMGGNHKARALYGMGEQELLEKIDEGNPVCVWTSMHDKEIERRGGWWLVEDGVYTEKYFEWPSNEHVVVLVDYDKEYVTVCDPLVGRCQYPKESFFRHYRQVGMYAMEIIKH